MKRESHITRCGKRSKFYTISIRDAESKNFSLSNGFIFEKKLSFDDAIDMAKRWVAFGVCPKWCEDECSALISYKTRTRRYKGEISKELYDLLGGSDDNKE